MNSERVNELINKSIDGLIDPDEKKELENFLDENFELRKEYEQIIKSSKILDTLPDYKTPDNIKKNIMNVIESTNPQPAFNNKLKPGKLSFKNRKVVFALAFGMAVIIGIFVLWNRIDNSSYSNEPISGYMGSSESAPSDAREIYSTDLKGIESSFGIYRKKDTLFVSMNKKNSDEISIGYSFDPVSVSFVGIKENNLISSAVKQVPGKASITISDPSRILAMFLVNKPSSEMDVQVRDFERQIFRYKFNIDKK